MKEFSVLMSLVDYIPVALFTFASVILSRDLYNKMSKGAFALFSAGTIDVICAGFLKATYKLLYALRICDFEALNNVFFPMQSLGFILAGIGILALLCFKQSSSFAKTKSKNSFKKTVFCKVLVIVVIVVILVFILVRYLQIKDSAITVIPSFFSGTFVFVTLMVTGLGFMDTGFCIIAKKLKKSPLIALFVLSFICSLCMGYLSSRDFTKSSMNWIAECVNIIGQGTLLWGALLMHKNGLEELRLHNEEIV